jgi:hypothetical protein
MSAARFDHSGGFVVFGRNPQRPPSGLDLLQAESQSTGGVRFGYDPHAIERPLTLTWRGISSADLAAIEIFEATIINGMAEIFTYTDCDGNEYSVRRATPILDSSEIASGRHNVTLELLEVGT